MLEHAHIYDWFRVGDDKKNKVCLSLYSTKHLLIIQKEDSYHLLYVMTNDNGSMEYITSNENLSELLTFAESQLVSINSFMLSDGAWKQDPPTLAQLQYVPNALTKWDVHKQMTSERIASIAKRIKREAEFKRINSTVGEVK